MDLKWSEVRKDFYNRACIVKAAADDDSSIFVPIGCNVDTGMPSFAVINSNSQHMIVTGCAGSGKTNLSYIMSDGIVAFNSNVEATRICVNYEWSAEQSAALSNIVDMVERRQKMLSAVSAKNIDSWNDRVVKRLGMSMSDAERKWLGNPTGVYSNKDIIPRHVVVLDGVLDHGAEYLEHQKGFVLLKLARACGVHVIAIGQRETHLSGDFRAHFGSRLMFHSEQVSSEYMDEVRKLKRWNALYTTGTDMREVEVPSLDYKEAPIEG